MWHGFTGDAFLVVTGSSQPKIYDRDGHELGEFVKGDMYIRDLRNTKGHLYRCCAGQWHPDDRCARRMLLGLLSTQGTAKQLHCLATLLLACAITQAYGHVMFRRWQYSDMGYREIGPEDRAEANAAEACARARDSLLVQP